MGCLVVEGKDLLVIRVRLNNNDQLWHLYQALRGHCEVEMVPDSEGPVLEIPSTTAPAVRQCSAGSMVGSANSALSPSLSSSTAART